jgi:hypothetical protein
MHRSLQVGLLCAVGALMVGCTQDQSTSSGGNRTLATEEYSSVDSARPPLELDQFRHLRDARGVESSYRDDSVVAVNSGSR